MSMSYHYAWLAVGRLPKWKDIYEAVPCDMEWNELPVVGMDGAMQYWCDKVHDYKVEHNIMYCRLIGT